MELSSYAGLNRAQLSFDYLHTNSTTHEFLFGALAELVDNARDASSTKLNIYTSPDEKLRGGHMLCFLDDGEGMDPVEACDIITFGRSSKKSFESHLIGMYGNGLKSGSMRIGNDLMVFTKKGPRMTCLLLSRTFHEEENIDEIIVPMPVFDSSTRKAMAKSPNEKQKHELEIQLILKYSPFHTESALMKEFTRIDSTSGTLVIIFNLKLLDSGEPELDVKSDATDILLANPEGRDFDTDEGLMPERRSFRAYTSIMYVDPRMRIYIQGGKVRTKRLVSGLYKPRVYRYMSSRFRTRSEAHARKAQDDAKAAENRAKEAESKARDFEKKYHNSANKEQRAELRRIQTLAVEMRKDVQLKKQIAQRKVKSLKDPKCLNFIFGININNRSQDGMFVYNCSRLIKMYQKVGPQSDGGVFCSGIVGIVDVPYLVLEPTHNKQDFADAKEYRHLQKAMGEHMVQYWKDLAIAQQGVTKFWENFGYTSSNWRDEPSTDAKFARKRAMQVQVTLQCDLCLKWRQLPFSANSIGKEYSDGWVCSMNADPLHNRCSSVEEKRSLTPGVLKKEVKSKEEKEKTLEEEIRKKQEQLSKMSKTKVVTSSRQVREEVDESDEDEDEDEGEQEESEEEEEKEVKKVSKCHVEMKSPPSKRRESVRAHHESKSPTLKRNNSSKSAPHKPPSRIKDRKRLDEVDDDVAEDDDDDGDHEEEEDESEQEEEDEETPDEPPTKRSRPVENSTKQTTSSTSQSSRRSSRDAVTIPTKKISSTIPSSSSRPTRHSSGRHSMSSSASAAKRSKQNGIFDGIIRGGAESEDIQDTEPDDGKSSPAHTADKDDGEVGSKVQVKVENKWCSAVVVADNKKQETWRVKFDKRPQDKHDLWVDKNSLDVKSVKDTLSAESPTKSPESGSTTHEAPTSSTVTAVTASSQTYDDIANGYRTCLRYFLPPQWMMDKDAVSTLTVDDLATFPLDDFFDHYEKGLRKLVSSFQVEASGKQQEAEQVKSKLSAVRRMIAKLLKSINEDFDIDPNSDTDQVDELLALCVKQATESAAEQE